MDDDGYPGSDEGDRSGIPSLRSLRSRCPDSAVARGAAGAPLSVYGRGHRSGDVDAGVASSQSNGGHLAVAEAFHLEDYVDLVDPRALMGHRHPPATPTVRHGMGEPSRRSPRPATGLVILWGPSSCCTWPTCLLYTSDAADDLLCVDLGGR